VILSVKPDLSELAIPCSLVYAKACDSAAISRPSRYPHNLGLVFFSRLVFNAASSVKGKHGLKKPFIQGCLDSFGARGLYSNDERRIEEVKSYFGGPPRYTPVLG